MTRQLYERTTVPQAPDVAIGDVVQALLDEGLTSAQRERVAERLGVTDDEGEPDGDALTTPEDDKEDDE